MKIKYPLIEDMWHLLGFVAIVSVLLFDPLGIISANAVAQDPGTTPPQNNDTYQMIIDMLVMIFILAVLIEVALSVLFRWRVFLRKAEGKGWKFPIAFVVSLAIVIAHQIDLPSDVVVAFADKLADGNSDTPAFSKEVGFAISALIIAGGSSSVNSVFERLGWRNPLAQQQKAEQERQKTQGRLWVQVTRPANTSSVGQPLTVSIDGVAVGMMPPGQDNFGGQNGHTVAPGSHTIDVSWTDQAGSDQKASKAVVVAAGATISETLTLS